MTFFRCLLLLLVLGALTLSSCQSTPTQQARPLALYPDNPHYFLFRNRPEILVGSTEHYGAVLNSDFNYVRYLDELQASGLNLTRTFTGAYVEPAGAFNITSNTLAPAPDRFLAPWARSREPGYALGGNKFDLTQWDEAYFLRLNQFVREAARRGIVVEMNLFCPFYEESQWNLSPMNPKNNINGFPALARTNVYTLDRSGALLGVQEAMARRIVNELRDFDNVYFELCNEPYFGGVTLDWQQHMAGVISQAERHLFHPHLISQNVANGAQKVDPPLAGISIFNFHYTTPPDTFGMNYGLNRVVGNNETGFKGTNDFFYRREAWDCFMSGGGLFNHLDFSFAVHHEEGSFAYSAKEPGGGNAVFRRQLGLLRQVLLANDLVHARPAQELVSGRLPEGARARVMASPQQDRYLVYLSGPRAPRLQLQLDAAVLAGKPFRAWWMNPRTGEKGNLPLTSGKTLELALPDYTEDIFCVIHRPAPVRSVK